MNKSYLFLLLLLSGVGFETQAAVQDSLRLIELKGKKYVQYQIGKGETIYGICQRWQTTPADLIDLNPSLEKGLKMGQIINISYLPDKIKEWKTRHGKASLSVSKPVATAASTKPAYVPTPKAAAPKPVGVAAPKTQPDAAPTPKTAAAKPAPSTTPSGSKAPDYHVVTAGQTLYAISRIYGLNAKDLQNWNTGLLSIGQKIALNAKAAKQLLVITPSPALPPAKIDTIRDTFHLQTPQQVAAAAPTKPPVIQTPPPAASQDFLNPVQTPTQPATQPTTPVIPQPTPKPATQPATQPEPAPQPTNSPLVSPPEALETTSFEGGDSAAAKQPTAAQAQQDAEFSFTGQYDQTPEAYYPMDGTQRILLVPFDLYLYFSDADDEIATRSKIPRTKIRQYFRRRLDVLIDPPGYETIHLLGGSVRDSLLDLDRIYRSLSYSYQDFLYPETTAPDIDRKRGLEVNQVKKSWAQKQKDKVLAASSTKAVKDKNESKYYGVKIKDPNFFTYFNKKYGVKYYVFINQFEVKTNYENCIDRARQNYERNFLVHFSIYDEHAKQIAGNKIKIYYESNSNSILQIVADNMEKMAAAILSQLPAPAR